MMSFLTYVFFSLLAMLNILVGLRAGYVESYDKGAYFLILAVLAGLAADSMKSDN